MSFFERMLALMESGEGISRSRAFFVSLGMASPIWLIIFFSASAGLRFPEMGSGISGWLWVVLVFPVFEELAFRGFLMGLLRRLLPMGGFSFITLNNFVTSILFSIAHFFTRSLVLGLLVFIPSLWLGLIREKTSSIALCIAIHVTWNLGFFSAMALGEIHGS